MANDAPTRPQKQVTIPIVDTEECRDSLFNVLPTVDQYLDKNGELCAGGEAQKDACTVRLKIFLMYLKLILN